MMNDSLLATLFPLGWQHYLAGGLVIGAGVALLFVSMAVMSFAAGEPFLGVMSASGAGMTVWVGLRTLLRG